MTTTVLFGGSQRCELQLERAAVLAAERSAHPPITELEAAMRAALARPNGFPALAAATVPGDRVAVVLDDGVPQPTAIVRGAIAALIDAGVEPDCVTVVTAAPLEGREQLEREFVSNGDGGVHFEQHDPDDDNAMAMVGVMRGGEPLRLNRKIAEADFVLPIAAARLPSGDRLPCRFEGLFPQFSNREASSRVHAQLASESSKEQRKLARQIDEAGWLAGIQMTVSVVRGGQGAVAAVLAGAPDAVAEEAGNVSRAIWERAADRPADLVIATVTGNEDEQTWENVARAVAAAAAVLVPGGAIAICSELACLPDGPLNRLKGAVDFGEVQEKLAHDDHLEASSARILARALDSGPVYLRSRLPADVVESMGMTPIQSDAELSRLAARREYCVVLEEAQRLAPRLKN